MSASLKIAEGAWVVVADGRKALLLVNQGDDIYPNLQISRVLEAPANPSTAAQGTDRPGRAVSSGGRRAAVDQTDWHAQAETAFAKTVVETFFAGERPKSLIIVAAPRFLAELRKKLPTAVKNAVQTEIEKDLTHLSAYEIEQHLTG